MLILSRCYNEEIYIDVPEGFSGRIVVTYLGGNKSRIGVEAPKEVTIRRAELTLEQKKEGKC